MLGSAASNFYNNNIKIDITPPTLLTGENMEFSSNNALTVCVPLQFDNGHEINLDISYKENV
jgi:chemotaxis protein CheX